MASINLGGSIGTTAVVAILGNYGVIFASDANHTLISVEYSNYFLEVTSSIPLTTQRNLISPLVQGQSFIIQNKTTGGQSIQVIGSSGTGIIIPNGQTYSVVCDGTNYITSGASSTVGGDLSGNLPNPMVVKIQGNPIKSQSLGALQDGYLLTWKNSDGEWEAEPSSVSFNAGGDLSGNNTTQYIQSISGNNDAGGNIPINATTLTFGATQISPTITQTTISGSPQNLTIQAQTSTGHATGGNLILQAGYGAVSDGALILGDTSASNYILLDGSGNCDFVIANRVGIAISGIEHLSIDSSGITLDDLAGSGAGYVAVDNTGLISFTSTVNPGGMASGDLSGSYPSPEVSGLLNYTLPALSDGYLTWTGSAWAFSTLNIPTSLPPNGSAGGDLSGTYPNPEVSSLLTHALPSLSSGYLEWNGSAWLFNTPSTSVTGTGLWYSSSGTLNSAAITLDGDVSEGALSGSNIPLEVTGLLNNALPSLSDGYLAWTGSAWAFATISIPSSLPPSGTAGGDLGGTYPNPSVVKINGTSVSSSPSINQILVATSGTTSTWELISDAQVSGTAAIAGTKISPNFGSQNVSTSGTLGAGGTTVTSLQDTAFSSAGVVHNDSSGNFTSNLIVNADVNAAAAIAYSKLNLTNSIVNADINTSAAIVYSKLNLTGDIVNSDIASSAAIAVSKLAAGTDGYILQTNGSGVPAWTQVGGDGYISTTGSFTVKGIQTIPVSSTAPSLGQVLQYNGTQYVPSSNTLSQVMNFIPLTSDGYTNIYTVSPNLALNEVINIAATINIASNDGYDGYSALWSRRFFAVQNIAGTLSDPAGNTTDQNSVPPIIGTFLSSAAAQIAISGTDLLVQVQRPTGMSGLYAAATVDLVRGTPAIASAVLSASPNTVSTIISSPQTITVNLNFGGTGATAITVDGVSLSSITVVSDAQITGVLAANTYSAGTGNVVVTAPANPLSLTNGFTFATAPTLTAPSSPFIASASGGGASLTLQGTNLNGVTSVTVGAASATSLSSTSTSVTFTPPANTASATSYNITFTGTYGSVTLNNTLFSIPANITHAWYAPQYNSAAGTWTDLVGGEVLAVGAGSYTKPTVTSSWTNSQPGVTYSGTNGLINTSTPSSQAEPASIFACYNVTATTTYNMVAYGGISGSSIFAVFQLPGSHNISIQAGGTSFASTQATSSTPQLVEAYFLNGTNNSSVNLNNGTAQVGSTSTTAAVNTGFTIGARYDGGGTISSGLIGSVGFVALYNGTPTSGERTIIHSILQSVYAIS